MEEARRNELTEKYLGQAAKAWEYVYAGHARISLERVYVMLQAMEESPLPPPGDRPDLVSIPERLSNSSSGGTVRFGRSGGIVESQTAKFSPPIPLFKALSEANQMVLLGEPGAGKSTTLQFIGLCCAQGQAGSRLHLNEDCIPVRIDLRSDHDLLAKGANFEKALAIAVTKILRPQTVDETEALELVLGWLESGRLLVLLDGLDEVPAHKRPDVRQEIQDFTRAAERQGCRLIVASRRAEYTRLGDPFKDFTIKPFGRAGEARPYIESWLRELLLEAQKGGAAEKAGQLIRKMEDQPGLKRVMDNPLILRLSAEIFARDGEVGNSRSDLYARYVEHLWSRAVDYRGADAVQKAQALEALEILAWDLQTGSAKKLLDHEALLREKMGLVARSGEKFTFSHTTLQEHFVALRLSRRWKESREDTWSFLKPRLHIPAWREPQLLFVGSLESSEAGEYVRRVMNAGSAYERFLHRDLALAASLVGENRSIEARLVEKLFGRIRRLMSPLSRIFIAGIWFLVFVLVWLLLARSLLMAELPPWMEGFSPWLILLFGLLWMALFLISIPFSPVSNTLFDPSEDRKSAIRMLEAIEGKKTIPILISALKGRDTSVRKTAARAIQKLGSGEAVPILISALKGQDDQVRKMTAEALGEMGAGEAIPELVAMLKDWSIPITVHMAAARALGEIGVEAIPSLLSASDEVHEYVREDIAEALGEIGVEAIPYLTAALKQNSYVTGSVAAQALGFIGAEAIPALLAVLVEYKDADWYQDPDVPYRVFRAFLGIRRTQALPPLVAALKDEDAEVRKMAAVSLVGGGILKMGTAPESSFQDEYAALLEAAAAELAALGTVEGIPHLLAELKDGGQRAYWAAIDDLGRLGPGAVPHLREALKENDQDQKLRGGIAVALGKIGAAEALPELIAALDDPDYEVRQAAAQALGEIRDVRAIPYLKAVLWGDEFGNVIRTAAWALGEIGYAQAVRDLRNVLLSRRDDHIREMAAQGLGKIGPRAIPILESALWDESDTVSGAAAQALGKLIGDQEIKFTGEERLQQIRFLRRLARKLGWITRGRDEALVALSIVAERLDLLNLTAEPPSKFVRSLIKVALGLLFAVILAILGVLFVISGALIKKLQEWVIEIWDTLTASNSILYLVPVVVGIYLLIQLFKLLSEWVKKRLTS